MIESQTLFIVGAGASTEVGLPTGSSLKDDIANAVRIEFDGMFEAKQRCGSREIVSALYEHAKQRDGIDRNIHPYLPACQRIHDAMPQAISVDNFLNDQRDEKIELCGKLAITHCILEAERNSSLYHDWHNQNATLDFNDLKDTWYNKFMQILTQGCHINDIRKRFGNINVITFNYDRCIEQFIFHWVRKYYDISKEDAEECMKNLNIIHPYGAVGRMHWQDTMSPTHFGEVCSGERLLHQAQQIKTFTERVEEQSMTKTMCEFVRNSNLIVFLGFAFHPQNMELITPELDLRRSSATEKILATARSISESDRQVIHGKLAHLVEKAEQSVHIEFSRHDIGCSEFFDEYWRTLALS